MGVPGKAARARADSAGSNAEKAVFSWLARQWSAELKGRRIPAAVKQRLRRDPLFRTRVAAFEQHGVIADVDPYLTPTVVVALNGETHNRYLADFAGVDPRKFMCRYCGGEKAATERTCAECR